jgi:RimJ/RimL family protein N-acetyltransferase
MTTARHDDRAGAGSNLDVMSERTEVPVLHTERLVLREWRESDRAPFAAMNADPVVMDHFPSTLTQTQSDDLVDRLVERWSRGRPSLWAVGVPGEADFIGFVGLLEPSFDEHFTPCVEVGWRLDARHWGRGYAPEGARAALTYGFEELGLDEIVSFTIEANANSRRVMEKIGLHHDPADDFDHPNVAVGDPCRRHVLYRMSADEWRRSLNR